MNWIAATGMMAKCIVNHAGIFDTRFDVLHDRRIVVHRMGKWRPYFDVPAKHEKFNPSAHVLKWKTPMLVTPRRNGFPAYQARNPSALSRPLQRRGIESQLLTFQMRIITS